MSEHGFMVVVTLFDPDDKRNPYEGLGFVVGPYPTKTLAEDAARGLRGGLGLLANIELEIRVQTTIFPAVPWWGGKDALGDLLEELEDEIEEVSPRKKHVRVEQDDLLGYFVEHGDTSLQQLCDVFDVSQTPTQRKIDGLVHQGKLEVVRRERPRALTVYGLPVPDRGESDV